VTNSSDPLLKLPEKELFEALSRLCHGHSAGEVACAALNLVVNSIRQAQPTLKHASVALDEVVARTRGVLASHYDANGRKKGIFPYDQVLSATRFDDKDAFRW
jgi:hypothetical protein